MLAILGLVLGSPGFNRSRADADGPAAPEAAEPSVATTDPPARPLAQAIARAQARCVKIYGAKAGREPGFATGLIVSADGQILTINSALLLGERIQIVLPDGSRQLAKIVRRSPEQSLALLQVPAVTPDFFSLSDGVAARQGDWALAVSNAFNVAQGREKLSVTLGVVSLRTSLEAHGDQDLDYSGAALILDAITSNPGAAGGAVVDVRGRLVGMLGKAIESPSTGTRLNYAIPTQELAKFISGRPIHHASPLVAADEAELGLRLFAATDPRSAPYVDHVISRSPAEAAGLRPDDLVLELADQTIRTVADYQQTLAQLTPGKPVVLRFKRKDEIQSVTLTPTARPKRASP